MLFSKFSSKFRQAGFPRFGFSSNLHNLSARKYVRSLTETALHYKPNNIKILC